MKAVPAASFEMAQAKFLFEFLIIRFDELPLFAQGHQLTQRDRFRQGSTASTWSVSFSVFGHSISSHCSACGSLRPVVAMGCTHA
jgi:hypothetical protein